MQINWKTRIKNKVFWATLIPAIAIFVSSVAQALGVDWTLHIERFVAIATALLTLVVAIGIVNDPNVEGLDDSNRAMNYDQPVAPDMGSGFELVKYEGEDKEPEYHDDFVDVDFSTGGGIPEDVDETERDYSNERALVEVEDDENTIGN